MENTDQKKEKILDLSEALLTLLEYKYTVSEACLAMASVMRTILDHTNPQIIDDIIEMVIFILKVPKDSLNSDDWVWETEEKDSVHRPIKDIFKEKQPNVDL
jgi:hypothetical protein